MAPTEGTVPALSGSAKEDKSDESVSYAVLDNLLGKVTRKNQEVMSAAFAISHDRLIQKIIWHLAKNGPMTSKQLLLKTGASAGAISKIINSLEERNIITRAKGSHGSEPLHIRDDLRETFRQHADHVERLVRSACHVLDEEERRALHTSLQKVYARLDAIGQQIVHRADNYIDFVQATTKRTVARKDSASGAGGQSEEQEASKSQESDCPHDPGRTVVSIEKQTRLMLESYERIVILRD